MKHVIYKILFLVFLLFLVFWLPFITIRIYFNSKIITNLHKLPESEAVIVFGTIVKKGQPVSALLKERLEAGIAILNEHKSKTIVVSNLDGAADVMKNYLIDRGVAPQLIEKDSQADKTPDTCKFEINQHTQNRSLIFVSQGFHLPRILYQCKKIGVEGTAFAAESLPTIDRSKYSLAEKFVTRISRYMREAGLTWLAFAGIYN